MDKSLKEEVNRIAHRMLGFDDTVPVARVKAEVLALYDKLVIASQMPISVSVPQEVSDSIIVDESNTKSIVSEVSNPITQKSVLDSYGTPDGLFRKKEDEEKSERIDAMLDNLTQNHTSTSEDNTTKRIQDTVVSTEKRSLNQRLKSPKMIGLNDRLAFVGKLFNGDTKAYNDAVRSLEAFDLTSEKVRYFETTLQPKYLLEWEKHEQITQRFCDIFVDVEA